MNASQEKRAMPGSDSPFGGQLGLTLIEALIALAILAAVGGVFLVAMSTSSKAVMVGQEQVSGKSLAKSQMESIKQENYRVDQQYTKISEPPGYDIEFAVERLDPRNDHTGNDQELQKITITITRGKKTVFTLEGYKCFTGQ
jgi:type II secretory pathway pseudopilin PulG